MSSLLLLLSTLQWHNCVSRTWKNIYNSYITIDSRVTITSVRIASIKGEIRAVDTFWWSFFLSNRLSYFVICTPSFMRGILSPHQELLFDRTSALTQLVSKHEIQKMSFLYCTVPVWTLPLRCEPLDESDGTGSLWWMLSVWTFTFVSVFFFF